MFNINNGQGTFTVVNGERVQNPRARTRSKKHLIPADKVIVVMGPTGVGKSTFINIAAGSQQVKVGRTLESCSVDIKSVEIYYKAQKVVLVDTPGFDDTHMSDTVVLGIIADWLSDTYRSKIKLTGIIYMHRISDIRMSGAPYKNLQMFANLCGTDAAEGVVMTTTMWDAVCLEKGEDREKQLRTNYWKDILEHQAQMERFDRRDGHEAAWNIIRDLCYRSPQRTLLIQQEMVNLERKLCETMAGKTLYQELKKAIEQRKAVHQQLLQKAREADDVDLISALMTECDALDTELEVLMKQVGVLKISLRRRLKRLLCFDRDQIAPLQVGL